MLKINYQGRLGNQLFINAGANIIAKKYDLYVDNYSYVDCMKLYCGKQKYNKFIYLNDENIYDFIQNNEKICHGININCYFQIEDFVLFQHLLALILNLQHLFLVFLLAYLVQRN